MKLFKDRDELKKYVSISNGTQLNSIGIFETDAFERFMKPYISQAFFDAMVAQYAATPNANWTAIIERTQRALAKFMMFLWVPEAAVNVDDNGISVFRNDKYQPASDAKILQIQTKNLYDAYNAFETLLQYLEENKTQTEVSLWKSNAYDKYRELFINTSVDFSNYVAIAGRRVFVAIAHKIKDTEGKEIKAALGKDLFDKLKDEMKQNGTMTDELTALLQMIKPPLAKISMAKSLNELDLKITEFGIHLLDVSITDAIKLGKADQEKIDALKAQYMAEAAEDLKALEDFLFDNADGYPEYSKPDEKSTPIKNTPDSPNFYL